LNITGQHKYSLSGDKVKPDLMPRNAMMIEVLGVV